MELFLWLFWLSYVLFLFGHHIMVKWKKVELGLSMENVQWLIWFTRVRFVLWGCNTLWTAPSESITIWEHIHANSLCIVVLHGNDGLVLMHQILYVVNSVNFCFVLMVLMLVNGLETNDVVSGCEWCVNVVCFGLPLRLFNG